jgi:fucose permease
MGPGFGDHIVASVRAFVLLIVGVAVAFGIFLGAVIPALWGWIVEHVRWVP